MFPLLQNDVILLRIKTLHLETEFSTYIKTPNDFDCFLKKTTLESQRDSLVGKGS